MIVAVVKTVTESTLSDFGVAVAVVPKISTWLLRQQNNERALTMEYIETRSQDSQ
jgi:hypothetical protein